MLLIFILFHSLILYNIWKTYSIYRTETRFTPICSFFFLTYCSKISTENYPSKLNKKKSKSFLYCSSGRESLLYCFLPFKNMLFTKKNQFKQTIIIAASTRTGKLSFHNKKQKKTRKKESNQDKFAAILIAHTVHGLF